MPARLAVMTKPPEHTDGAAKRLGLVTLLASILVALSALLTLSRGFWSRVETRLTENGFV